MAEFFNSLSGQRLSVGMFRQRRAVDMYVGRGTVPVYCAIDVRLTVHVFPVHTFHQSPELQRIHILLSGDV
jgi:hypothetical protein